ncbi:MAG: tyrosine recombinase XerC [Chthoniobacteraceae bacterium]
MPKKPKQWPRKIRSGQSYVTLYRHLIGGVFRHQLVWMERGKVEKQTITDQETAIGAAQVIADRLAAGEGGAMTLNAAESAVYLRALGFCGDTPLDVVCRDWADARTKLNGLPLSDVVADFLRRTQGESVTVCRLIELFEADRRAHNVTDVYLKRLAYRLDRISAAFGPRSVREVSETDIRRFLDGQAGGEVNRKNMRDAFVTLWRFARRERYLPRDLKTEAELVEAPKIKRRERVEIFSPEEMRKLLAAAPAHIRPLIAICGFSGVRSQGELSRLRWEDVKWDRHVIDVAGKTGERRFVPLMPNLAAWLADFREAAGSVAKVIPDKAFLRVSVKAGVKWKHNALRHSFGSYRVAATKSVDQTSLEMGNSAAMVRKHYLEAVHAEEAAAWFGVLPCE